MKYNFLPITKDTMNASENEWKEFLYSPSFLWLLVCSFFVYLFFNGIAVFIFISILSNIFAYSYAEYKNPWDFTKEVFNTYNKKESLIFKAIILIIGAINFNTGLFKGESEAILDPVLSMSVQQIKDSKDIEEKDKTEFLLVKEKYEKLLALSREQINNSPNLSEAEKHEYLYFKDNEKLPTLNLSKDLIGRHPFLSEEERKAYVKFKSAKESREVLRSGSMTQKVIIISVVSIGFGFALFYMRFVNDYISNITSRRFIVFKDYKHVLNVIEKDFKERRLKVCSHLIVFIFFIFSLNIMFDNADYLNVLLLTGFFTYEFFTYNKNIVAESDNKEEYYIFA
ncbi:MAG: hypothetical protein CL760_01575 [Chloroflexi bacterium]|nr:hypothetical protein [Chloroflexota bacterium]|tara:strand:+ start:60045 stop:61064 length:1020 start_codon:yes stop_codon:yes gene_type:complete